MIRPRSITIEGFRSFRHETTYHFPIGSGLYLVTGRNKLEPKLASNASGKSSLFDAMCWCLYGKSARGLKAGNVSHWSGEYLTSVQLTLEVTSGSNDKRTQYKDATSGERNEASHRGHRKGFHADGGGDGIDSGNDSNRLQHTICRTHNPNSIRLDGEETDQQSIDQLIGVNYDGFLATVLLGQFNRFFFDLTPTEKLDVFSNALDLSQWITAADKAKQRSKEFVQTIQQVEADRNATKSVIVNIQSNAKNLTLATRTYEKDRQYSKQVLQAYIQQREPELEQASKQLRRQQKELTRLLDRQDELNRKADKLDKELNGDRHKGGWGWKEAEDAKQQAIRKVQEIKERIGQLSRKDCPTCGQRIDHKRCEREISKLIDASIAAKDLVDAAENYVLQLREELDAIKINQAETLAAIQRTQKERAEANKQADRLTATCRNLKHDIDGRKDKLSQLDNQADPYANQLTQLKRDENLNQQKLADLNGQHANLTKRLKATEFWTKGFKELRLWIIQDAIVQLQVEVDNALTQLGLHGWKVELAIEKETKNGKLQRGFTVNIKSPDSEETAVPWEAWSGGETQRIRIAGANGLQKLIQQHNGLDWGMEVWDEPTQHLSERGIADLLLFLEAKAKDEQRQIWIITHTGLQAGNFDGIIEVVKGNNGSKIVEIA